MKPNCPKRDAYRQLLDGTANSGQAQLLVTHLEECPACAETVQDLLTQDPLADRLARGSPSTPGEPLPADLVARLLALSSAKDKTIGHRNDAESEDDFTGMLSPPLAPDELGRLGEFIVRGVLGQGGMGVVFRADDPRLEREVALKVIRPGDASNPTARQRFLSEARSAAKVNSDHIVTIYDIGESQGVAYVAMELLKGTSLGAALNEGGAFSHSQILRIARETAVGLAAAHEKGLIHRDIKPDNIWLEAPDQRVKLLDFGLARPVDREVHLTNLGFVVGTPSYMAPEQANGHRVDARCDLFALGCVLYRLAAGRVPFTGATILETLNSLATVDPPRVRRFDRSLPPELDDLIARLLAKDPELRPPTARAVVEEIRAIEARSAPAALGATLTANVPVRSGEKSRSRRSVLLGFITFALVAATLAIIRSPGEHDAVTEPTAPAGKTTESTDEHQSPVEEDPNASPATGTNLPEEGRYYRIKNVGTRKVLSIEDGDKIVMAVAGPRERQQWRFVKVGDYYKVINHASGMALDVVSGSKEEGAELIPYDDDGGENQQWSLERKNNYFVFRARHSGMVINPVEDTKARGSRVVQNSYRETGNQLFELVPIKK